MMMMVKVMKVAGEVRRESRWDGVVVRAFEALHSSVQTGRQEPQVPLGVYTGVGHS